jgi:hypothetical protein
VRRRLGLLAALPVAVLALAGCSSTLEEAELETQAASALEAQVGFRPDVDCPEDIPAEVDATTECVATEPESGEELRIRITVTSVEGDQAEFTVEPIE